MTFTDGGNVGIGTASPATTFDCLGDATLSVATNGTRNLCFRNSTVGVNYATIKYTDSSGLLTLQDGYGITFNGASEWGRWDSSGRLLVGTSTYDGNARAVIAGNTGGSTGALDIRLAAARPTGADAPIGTIRFISNDNTSSNYNYASIDVFTDGTSTSNADIPGRLVFSTTADGASSPTARATINNLGYLTGTVNGLSSGIYPAQQYYRLNADYTGSNVNTAQSLFGVGVTLIGSTQYEFECLMAIEGLFNTTITISALFGGTATINNIFFMGTGPGIGGTAGYDAAPASFYYRTAAGGAITAAMAPAGGTYSVAYLIKGTVSINAGGTFIPQYQFSAAPGAAWVTARGSYFSIWPLGASGSNISIGSWT